MTPFEAIAWEPFARLMLIIAGRSCGVRPTAKAIEKRRESKMGFWKNTLTAKIPTTSINITSVSK